VAGLGSRRKFLSKTPRSMRKRNGCNNVEMGDTGCTNQRRGWCRARPRVHVQPYNLQSDGRSAGVERMAQGFRTQGIVVLEGGTQWEVTHAQSIQARWAVRIEGAPPGA
jgi:hypothetical protein